MIIDSYIHIHPFPTDTNGVRFPPGYGERMAERMRRIGIDPYNQAKDIVRLMDGAGVDVAVVQNPFHDPASGHTRTNDSVYEAIKDYPGRLYAFAGFHVKPSPDLAELERAVVQLGMKGVRMLPSTMGFMANDWDLMHPVYTRLIELDIPLFAQAGPTFIKPDIWKCDLRTWYDVARRYPELKLVVAHGGHGALGGLEWAMAVANASPNGYIDLAAFPYFCSLPFMPPRRGVSPSDVFLHEVCYPETPDGKRTPAMQRLFEQMAEEHGRLVRDVWNHCPGKLIYGTDVPFAADFRMYELYREALGDQAVFEEVCGGIMRRLLKI